MYYLLSSQQVLRRLFLQLPHASLGQNGGAAASPENAQNRRQSPTSSRMGLASNPSPVFLSYPTPSKPGSYIRHTALLLGKHPTLGSRSYSSYGGLPTPPGLPNLTLKGTSDRDVEGSREKEKDRKKREQSTAIALLAGQTLFKRLRGAFWDAFTTSTPSHTSSSSSPSSLTATKNRDIDGVWKVKFVVVVHI